MANLKQDAPTTDHPPLVESHAIQRDLGAIVIGESLVGHVETVHRLVP